MLSSPTVHHPSSNIIPLKISMNPVAEGDFLTICVQAAIFQLLLWITECWTKGTEPLTLEYQT